MHRPLGTDDPSTEGLSNTLMPQTDSEDGNLSSHLQDGLHGETCLFGSAGSWRDDEKFGLFFFKGLKIDQVVSIDLANLTQFTKVLNQVIGEGIIVIDQKDHRSPSPASSMALKTARALFRVSSYSFSGIESATIPAPVWT